MLFNQVKRTIERHPLLEKGDRAIVGVSAGVDSMVLLSGSTGKSKAALHNFAKFVQKFKVPRRRLRTINFLLFDHIGGVNTLFYTLSNGGVVITTQERDPDVICRLIAGHKVELLPTTPTFLNLFLISELYRHYDLSSLKLITYGTEVMPEAVLKRLRRALPPREKLEGAVVRLVLEYPQEWEAAIDDVSSLHEYTVGCFEFHLVKRPAW